MIAFKAKLTVTILANFRLTVNIFLLLSSEFFFTVNIFHDQRIELVDFYAKVLVVLRLTVNTIESARSTLDPVSRLTSFVMFVTRGQLACLELTRPGY